jgi:hypothetical protein
MIFTVLFKAFASSESSDLFDKSYPRDNSYCSLGNKRLEVMIRGSSVITEASDRGYGENVFYKLEGKKPELFEFSKNQTDTYHFFKPNKSLCSNSQGYVVGTNLMALLLLKENRPFKDKLVLQLFDLNSMRPGKFIETDLPVVKAQGNKEKFLIKVWDESHRPEIGKVTLQGEVYIYNEQVFPKWMIYKNEKFEIHPEETFKDFPIKNFFKTLDEFNLVTGWSQSNRIYLKDIFFLAVNHQAGKQCILFVDKKQIITGSEAWRCQAM